MKKHIVKIKSIEFINYNVLEVVTEKPENYDFEPWQATEIAINLEGCKNEKRPFTFTNLPREKDLQFTIKVYPSLNGVTKKLSKLEEGAELILGDVFGAIQFKGKGVFLAGGAGVTPFIAIFKSLGFQNEMDYNSLIFANKTEKDIFLEQEFETLLGKRFMNILSEEETQKYPTGHIDRDFLKSIIKDFSQYFYVCGPPEMTESVTEDLKSLGVAAEKIVIEDYD
ncbi:flavodoxin reductase [Maribacter sp. PR1]|uniref:Flavodoxin reductase n=1 Tax=Maribacter cobaltidurans TaxID=1178778 RepID=A0ABU7ITN9_9FLAO|nr:MULTISPECIES: flavodoxin reductase [Maribacter]MDC6388871.1 flavodoxin reductase [Maribacter sp. PR1]MEE1976259.1 flavodoxin reductase [Maribacter cobaltidurans]